MSVISKIETGCYRVPLPVVLSDSTHGDLTHFELILVQIEDAEGSKGVGYTYTVGSGGEAARVLVESLRRTWRYGLPCHFRGGHCLVGPCKLQGFDAALEISWGL